MFIHPFQVESLSYELTAHLRQKVRGWEKYKIHDLPGAQR